MPGPDPLAEELDALRAATGFQPLNRWWAKVEILFGLTAAGLGLLVALFLSKQPDAAVPWWTWLGPLLLFVLGIYLALAGHRSHLYQSNIRIAAHIARRLRDRDRGEPHHAA